MTQPGRSGFAEEEGGPADGQTAPGPQRRRKPQAARRGGALQPTQPEHSVRLKREGTDFSSSAREDDAVFILEMDILH